jgi:galactose mutarotase-like enzyme
VGDGFVTIGSGGLTARINPFGAELCSLRDGAGAEYMTDADPTFWSGHAPLLFPIVGGLADDTLRHDGVAYRLPRHGFARRSGFAVVRCDADRAEFRLEAGEATRAVYPFDFALDMAFAVAGNSLTMAATVTNRGDGVMPFSFGYHPAFAWPLPGADKPAHRIVFATDEPAAVRRLDPATGLLLAQGEPSPVVGRDLPLREDLFAADAVIWTDLASRSLAYGADGGPWLDISFEGLPYLGLWQKPGARFVCIEPWAGYADPVGYAGDFAEKPGIELLAPGQSRRFAMVVRLRAA